MKREYKDYNLELNLPENFYLINPKKYKELNLKSIDQMNLIDAFAVKEEDVISNIVSFYECEDFEFDKINFDISLEKINDSYSSEENDIVINHCIDYDFNGKKGLVVLLNQNNEEEVFVMQLYFEHNDATYCFNFYINQTLSTIEEIEENCYFNTIKGIINEI